MDEIINGESDKKNRSNIEKEILQSQSPNIWNFYMDGNMEQRLEVDFKMYAMSVSDHLSISVNNMTVFDFYTSIKYLKEKFKTKK